MGVPGKAMVTTQQIALLGVADDTSGQFIARETGRIARAEAMMPIVTTRDFSQLLELSERFPPAAILLDDALMDGAPLAEPLARLAAIAPVVLIAAVERQA